MAEKMTLEHRIKNSEDRLARYEAEGNLEQAAFERDHLNRLRTNRITFRSHTAKWQGR